MKMSEKYSFKVLRKKIEKVDAMLKDLDPSGEKHGKMEKKRAQYMKQLKETPEWETEGGLIEKKERLMREAKRLREAANQAEQKRHQLDEDEANERKKKSDAREEARRMMREKKEKEEARRKAEKEAKLKAQEEEKKAKEARFREREERERREKEEGERRAREEQERREREELEKQETEKREKEERERRAKEEQERREREEEERLAREEQGRIEREQAEQVAKEARERFERDEAERLAKEEQESHNREQEEMAATEERKRIERAEADHLAAAEQEVFEGEKEEEAGTSENSEEARSREEREKGKQQHNEAEPEDEDNDAKTGTEEAYDGIRQIQEIAEIGSIAGGAVEMDRKDPVGMGIQGVDDEALAVRLEDLPKIARNETQANDEQNLEQQANEQGSDTAEHEDNQEPDSAPEVSQTAHVEAQRSPPRSPMGGMGGLFVEIGHKKKEMDSARKPIEEKTTSKLKAIVETKQTNAGIPTIATSEKPKVRVTSRATGEEELSDEFISARQSVLTLPRSENTKKILQEISATEEYHKKLEKHLNQNGIPIPADIPYEVCKDKIASITEKMRNLHTAEQDPYTLEKKYFELEQQMAKYSTAIMLTDEWAKEQQRLDEEWEEAIRVDNLIAIKQVRSHMPVNVRSMTEEALTTQLSPNGKVLPKQFAKKFKRTNVLQLLRVNPDDIEKMHPSYFEGMRTTGLTLTERRAIYEHMRGIGARWQTSKADKNVERKWMWHEGLKAKFKELQTSYDKHVKEYGPANEHPYAKRADPEGGGCPLIGNQCPVKADGILDYGEDYGYTVEAEYESSGSQKSSEAKTLGSNHKSQLSDVHKKKDDEEIMALLRECLKLDDSESEADKRFLRELFHAEKRTRLLEKSLAQAGIEIPEDEIPYAEARTKVEELTEQIKEVATKMGSTSDAKQAAELEKEYIALSSELDKFKNAMMLTKEWAAEQVEKERRWEEHVKSDNQNALKMIRRHMPVDIRDMSENALCEATTPNGKKLPQKVARKFKRTNILLLLRMDPSAIEPMHPSSLESMRTTGLSLTERRALHEHLKALGAKWKALSNDKMSERKWMWHESLRSKFRDLVDRYDEHVEKYGPPDNHPYTKRGDTSGGCPLLGNQCPIKADQSADYSEDYGYPEEAEYRTDSVAKSNLLTMEDIKKRREEDDAEFEEEAPKKAGGFLSAIMGRKN